jgi:virulence-associated protein VagC
MTRTAKLFRNGRSQAVRLPSDFRFEGSEVFVRRDPATGDVILSRRPESWEDFFVRISWPGVTTRPRRSGSSSDVFTLPAGHEYCQLHH